MFCSIFSNGQEERVLKIQSVEVMGMPLNKLHGTNCKIGGNIIQLNRRVTDYDNQGRLYTTDFAVESNTIDSSNSFIVYTKDKVDELMINQRKFIGEQTDTLKVFFKQLIDSLPKQTFVIAIQEQIQESTLDKLRKEDIGPQNQEIALLKEEIAILKKEVEELKKNPRN